MGLPGRGSLALFGSVRDGESRPGFERASCRELRRSSFPNSLELPIRFSMESLFPPKAFRIFGFSVTFTSDFRHQFQGLGLE
jgi:hypothetical protein